MSNRYAIKKALQIELLREIKRKNNDNQVWRLGNEWAG
jgi:hypothetical protein